MKFADVEQYPNEWLHTITHEDIENNSFPVIIDRDQSDADRITVLSKKRWKDFTDAEKRYWYGVVKGAYNDEDMNRVGFAVNRLAEHLTQLPLDIQSYRESKYVASDAIFTVPYDPADYDITAQTWEEEDIPSESDAETYLGNVALLRAAFDYPTDPLPTTMEDFSYTAANALEKALQGLNEKIIAWTEETQTLIDNTAAAFVYSGEVFAGEI